MNFRPAALLRVASTIGFLAIVTASVVPGRLRPHLTESGQLEHFIAYLCTALLFALWIRRRRYYALVGAALLTCAAIVEVLQLWIPDRHSQAMDFFASGAGTFMGLAIGATLSAAGRRIFK
jgi:VanZ family protein